MSPPSSPSSPAEEKVERLGESETGEPCCETLSSRNDLALQTRTNPTGTQKRKTAVWRGLTRKTGQEELRNKRGQWGVSIITVPCIQVYNGQKSNMNIKEKSIHSRASSGDQKDFPIYYGNQNQIFHPLASIKGVTYF